jgi:biopolymer transport protein ExbD
MAIYAPGKRDRHNRLLGASSRKIVAMLSLTAMVDMFTVLTIFLLQNYNTTGKVIDIPKEVSLPKASVTKQLDPAHVVTISNEYILLDNRPIVPFLEVKEQQDWMILPLYNEVMRAIRDELTKLKQEATSIRGTLRAAVKKPTDRPLEENQDNARKVTIQADKSTDFLTIKKVMFTITEAGGTEINFAVIQIPSKWEDAEAEEEQTESDL